MEQIAPLANQTGGDVISSGGDRGAHGRGGSAELLDFARVFWSFRWLIVACVVSALGIGALFYFSATPIYQSSAQIMITRRASPAFDTLQGGDLSRLDDLVSGNTLTTQMMVISSTAVIQRAVNGSSGGEILEARAPLSELSTLRKAYGEGKIVPFIKEGLSVERGGRSRSTEFADVLTVRYAGESPEESRQVLAGVVDSFQEYLNEESEEDESDVEALLKQMQTAYDTEYQNKRTRLESLIRGTAKMVDSAEGLGDANLSEIERRGPLVRFGADERAYSLDVEVLQVEMQRLSELETRIAEYEVLLAKINDQIGKTDPAALLDMVMRELQIPQTVRYATGVDESHLVASLKLRRSDINGQITNLLAAGAGPNDSRLRALNQQLEQLERELSEESAKFEQRRSEKMPDDPRLAVQIYRDSLREQLDVLNQERAQAKTRYEDALRVANASNLAVFEINILNKEIDTLHSQMEAFKDRLLKMQHDQADSGSPFVTRIIEPATVGRQIEPRRLRIMGMSGFLGVFAGLAAAFLLHSMDRSFADVDEVAEVLDLPVVGRVPEFGDLRKQDLKAGALVDASLRTFHAPLSHSSEAYRTLRNSLYFSIRGKGHSVIQVTSPVPGDGKSTLAANLAVAVAQSGRRVLLVDADFRRPRQHHLFHAGNAVGMSSVIEERAELPDAIVDTEINKLSLLPCGPIPANPAELLTSTRFNELLDGLRRQFDFVIVDTPPLLAVSDPAAVAARVDGVLLAMRLRKNAKPLALQAAQVIRQVDARVLGIVVNGLTAADQKSGGYGYGYGYGYGKYGYGYGYTADENGDEEAPDGAGADKSGRGRRGSKSPAGVKHDV